MIEQLQRLESYGIGELTYKRDSAVRPNRAISMLPKN